MFKSKQPIVQGPKQGKTEAVCGMEGKKKVRGFRGFQDQKYLQHEIVIREKAVNNIRKQHGPEQKRK